MTLPPMARSSDDWKNEELTEITLGVVHTHERVSEDPEAAAGRGGACRAQSRYRFVLPLIRFIPESLTYLVPLCLKRQCDRTPGAWDASATLEVYSSKKELKNGGGAPMF